jgi:hypothetical protein
MQIRYASAVVAALLFSPPSPLRAQSAPDPSGHWEGTVKAPGREIDIQIDLTRQPGGAVVGTITGETIHGFPLSDVGVERAAVRFALKVNGGGSFKGTIADDGKTIAGDFTTLDGANTIPFTLTRTGDVKADPPARNPAISRQLEGTWYASLDVNGESMHIVLKLSNRPDGTSAGTLANLDQGAVEIPITTITQKAAGITLDLTVVSGSYAGEVNADGTALTGTWTQGPLVAPLNFRRGETGK